MGCGPHALLRAGLVGRLEGEGIACEIIEIEPERELRAEIATTFDLHRAVRKAVEAAKREGRLPISLTGNCNTGVIGSLAAGAANDIGLFWFDAHSDAETPESSTSGFLDGMSFAMVLGQCWRPMLESTGALRLDGAKAALVGAREVSRAAGELLRENGVALVSPEQARTLSASEALAGAIRQLKAAGVRQVHVHVDLDVLDPDLVGPANSYALPGGVTEAQLQDLLSLILREFSLSSASIASYDPSLDPTGAVAAAGLNLVSLLAHA